MGTDDLKDRVIAAEYVIDAAAVAEAMLRRPSGLVLLGALLSDGGARTPAAPPPVRPA